MESHRFTSDNAPPKPLFTTVVGRLLGFLLLIAAALKIYGFGVDPVARLGIFSAPAFQFLVIVFELSLGLWLLSAKQSAGAWIVVVFTFLVFATASFYQGWVGQASCGCLGRKVSVNPWYMFVVDCVALAALAMFRPDFKPIWNNRARVGTAAMAVLGGYALLLAFIAIFSAAYFGSIRSAIAVLRGERLSVYPALVEMGIGVPGEERNASVELTNRTDQPIRLIGGTADCSCTVLGDLPVTIPAGESRSITVTMHLPKSLGAFNRKAQLTIDDGEFKRIGFRLSGRIEEPSE